MLWVSDPSAQGHKKSRKIQNNNNWEQIRTHFISPFLCLTTFPQEECIESNALSSTYKSTALSSGIVDVKLKPKSIRTYDYNLIWHVKKYTRPCWPENTCIISIQIPNMLWSWMGINELRCIKQEMDMDSGRLTCYAAVATTRFEKFLKKLYFII